MRVRHSIFLLLAVLMGCVKTKTTVHDTTIYTAPSGPSILVTGVQDITYTHGYSPRCQLNLSVKYLSGDQERVTLSVEGTPPPAVIDSGEWIGNGFPPFYSQFAFTDSGYEAVAPGTYPMTVVATTASGRTYRYPFTVTVNPRPWSLPMHYDSCVLYKSGVTVYADSIYADATDPGLIWFANFANTGHAAYALLSNNISTIRVPYQLLGSVGYEGTGWINKDGSVKISLGPSSFFDMWP